MRKPARVLLVDDHEPMRILNRILLEQTGKFRVIAEAGDGDEAIEAAKAHQPEVVLLDLLMPQTSGMEALPHLREVAPQARVIVYSMLVREGLAAEVEAMGATGFVDKGLPTESFVRRVAELAGLEVDAKA